MPTDDDTVPVRRETLRVLVKAVRYWIDIERNSGFQTVALSIADNEQAVREAEAQLRGEEAND